VVRRQSKFFRKEPELRLLRVTGGFRGLRKPNSVVSSGSTLSRVILLGLSLASLLETAPKAIAQVEAGSSRVLLNEVAVLVDKSEPSYVQYGAKDLGAYLAEISGEPVTVGSSADVARKCKSIIVIGETMAGAIAIDLGPTNQLGDDGSVIRSFDKDGTTVVAIAGPNPHGTNFGIATLMQMIRADAKSPYLKGPVDIRSKPSIAIRGLQTGAWPLKYPYAAWKERDWDRFIDMAWVDRMNLLLLAPLFEILPVPLSAEDEAYVQEVRRIVDYAQNKRGMEVWVGMPANRVAISDCGVRDPHLRPYWINGCQKDMNPADPQQFANIGKAIEPFYRIVNNADGILMGDADPGGWPQSPLSEQVKIFDSARKLLNRYNIHGEKAKLADFMWIGWGRHKFFTSTDRLVTGFDWTDKNPDESDIAFMAETIRNFKQNLPEPWDVFVGMTPYLEASRRESVLNKTIYFPYGAIEGEPAFPATNISLARVREVLDKEAEYSQLSSLMGNNQIMLLQFPLTYYFFASTWDAANKKRSEEDILLAASEQIYPEHKELLADSFLALRETDPDKIRATSARLAVLVNEGNTGRPGVIGRYLFPDQLVVARDLLTQLDIRAARQTLLKALHDKPDVAKCAQLVEEYFDKLLSWNQNTGWEKIIDTGIWTQPIYEQDKSLTEAISRLKEILGKGAPYTSYAQVNTFFDGIANDLLKKYGQNSVMIGCIEPLKFAVIQAQ
jgi:hypothetical protein